ncbi:hypothetical protein PVK06_028767 [Gossypium arboreum]|uniref:Neprosin PEP catalytic domain-containing protein n=1 Tax=Gossypium arboreum TaxID=29729 RepID=A0ABR0P4S9_GOSAR|nr:hypothetical protein PVK06_028767 [Gossypium arboreum]
MDKKIKALGLINYPTSSHFNTTGAGPIDLTVGNAYAAAHYVKHNFGAKTIMNVWSPTTLSDQASFAYLWIANGPADALNVVQAGWGVQPQLFSSNYSRLLTYWTVDGYRKTGCTNYLCPGFVQVHRQISLGMVLNQISIYNGTQKADKLVLSATRPDCYGSETAPDDAAPNAIDPFYGGPGQCNL